MRDYSIEFLDILPDEIDEKVEREHKAHESSHGIVCDYNKFSMVIRSGEGEPIGALSAYSAYAEIYVDDIWIDSRYRNLGFGRKLLGALEHRYKDRGYNNINLVTNQFQAAGFYQKCGFEIEFVRENKIHPKLSKIFLVKFFRSGNQCRGILNATN
jgi:ribosomal protein S18 acetylase RimI-like enzyme